MVIERLNRQGIGLDIFFDSQNAPGESSLVRVDYGGVVTIYYRNDKPYVLSFDFFVMDISILGKCEYEIKPSHEEFLRELEPFVYNNVEYTFEEFVEQYYRENKEFYDNQRTPAKRAEIAKLAT